MFKVISILLLSTSAAFAGYDLEAKRPYDNAAMVVGEDYPTRKACEIDLRDTVAADAVAGVEGWTYKCVRS